MTEKQTAYHTKTSFKEKLRSLWFSFYVARRYLFSKKSHNAVNIISAISSTGICVGTIAMVCVLSVFNGMDNLVTKMFSTFDPDLKITAVQGKTFRIDTTAFDELEKLPSVAVFTEVLEENALIMFKEKQIPATIKGIDERKFREMTGIDSIMYDGEFLLHDGGFERIVPGVGLANKLGLGAHFIDPIYIYAPKRTARMNILRPENSFTRVGTFVAGIFAVQQIQYDDNLALISLDNARSLFEYDEYTVSAIELKLTDNVSADQAKKEIRQLLGDKFSVKDRYEQQEDFYKILKMEKWITYLILCFVLLIASFNIIGSLTMLILDKKDDINTLRSMGADNRLIRRIFLLEGWLISITGAITGIVLGTLICLGQQHFGWLKMGSNFISEAYPVALQGTDVLLSFAAVIIMGFLTACYPVRYIRKKNGLA